MNLGTAGKGFAGGIKVNRLRSREITWITWVSDVIPRALRSRGAGSRVRQETEAAERKMESSEESDSTAIAGLGGEGGQEPGDTGGNTAGKQRPQSFNREEVRRDNSRTDPRGGIFPGSS